VKDGTVSYPHALDGNTGTVHARVPVEVFGHRVLGDRWYKKSLCGLDGKGLIITTAAVDCPACLQAITKNGGV
jgi:hypothetical protein